MDSLAKIENWVRDALKYRGKFEYSDTRPLRCRNKEHYQLAHWTIWIAVFFLSSGASAFALFGSGLDSLSCSWLLIVITGTGVAGWYGRLPGTELEPYILRFDEDCPNPLYRRICYAFAWNSIISFATLNMCGLLLATVSGHGYMKQIYYFGYPPLCGSILLAGAAGWLPRVGPSTKAEGLERRYFYSAVWSVTLAQVLLFAIWKMNYPPEVANPAKLIVFVMALALGSIVTARGLLPRTRPIVSGDLFASD